MAACSKLNATKSGCLFLKIPFNCEPFEAIPIGSSDRLLGFQLGVNINSDETWKLISPKFAAAARLWSEDSSGVFGRASGLKIFALSKLQYAANFGFPSEPVLRELNSSYWQGIFGHQTISRVKRTICCAPRERGGLNAFDLPIRLAATIAHWIPRIESRPGKWTTLFKAEATYLGAKYKVHSLLTAKEIPKKATQDGLVGAACYWWSTAVRFNRNLPKEENITVRKIYNSMMEYPPVVELFGASDLPELSKIWRWAYEMPLSGKAKEFRWRLWYKKLPLKRDNQFKRLENCPLCGQEMTQTHLFMDCHAALQAERLLSSLPLPFTISTEEWKKGWLGLPSSPTHVVRDIILTLAQYVLWSNYTATAFGGEPSNPTTFKQFLNTKLTNAQAAFKIKEETKEYAEIISSILPLR